MLNLCIGDVPSAMSEEDDDDFYDAISEQTEEITITLPSSDKKTHQSVYLSTLLHYMSQHNLVFTHESSYCFQRVLAIAILSICLSVCLSVRQVDQAKTVQARITKSSPSAAWKTLVSGTVKLFHKFERGHPERGC